MEKISKFGSEVGDSLSKEKQEPGWQEIWNLLSSENWQSGWDEQVEFMMYATHKLVCPENTMGSLRRDLEEVAKRINEEQCEKKIQKSIEQQLGWLVSFTSMDRGTIEMLIERKEQQEELRKLKEILAKKEEEERKREEQEIERKEEEERQSQLERKKREDRENESKILIEKYEKELEREKQERKQYEKKIKTLKTLVDGVVELAERERFKATREIRASEGNFRMSKQEPPIPTKIPLVPLTPHPISVFLICSINPNSSVSPRPFTISSFHPLLILTSLLSLHDFLRLAIPNPFLEMSTGMRPPPEPPPLL